MKIAQRPVTNETEIPNNKYINNISESVNSVTMVTANQRLYLGRSEIEEFLGGISWEMSWTGRDGLGIEIDRALWAQHGVQSRLFLKRWRYLNSINFAAYSRLTGQFTWVVRKALEAYPTFLLLEPLTGNVCISVKMPLSEGYSREAIKSAREDVRYLNVRSLDLYGDLS